MRYRALLFATFFCIYSLSAVSATGEKRHSDLLQCMERIGNYLFVPNQSLESLNSACVLQNEKDEWGVTDIYRRELVGIKTSYDRFSDKTLSQCSDAWQNDWAQVAAMVFEGVEGENYYHKSFLNIPEDASEVEREIMVRSLLDQALSRFIVNTYGSKFVQYDGTSCRWLYSNLSLARADNVAFSINKGLKEKYLSGDVKPFIYRPFWFVLQHADLFHNFRYDWFNTLKKTHKTRDFPKRLVDALEKRIEYNRQFSKQ